MIPRRHRLRARMTLLYAVPFFLTGSLLFLVPLVGARETVHAGPGGAPPPTHEVHAPLLAGGLTLIGVALVSLVLGWFVAGRLLRPLRTITATAREISATDLHRRLGPGFGDDEFGELADTLDDLFARLAAAFDAQRHFVANAAHELRSPLAAERAVLQVALADADADPAELRAACQDVLSLGRDQERLIDALLTLATGEQGVERREPFDLADLAEAALTTRRDEAARREVRLEAHTAPARVSGDPDLVASLLANLLDNALRYNVAGGWVAVRTGSGAGSATLTVSNTGPVVPAEELPRLLQPFQRLGRQRTRHGGGYGLGLAIVRAIANAHGATVDARPRPEGGLEIRLAFPGRDTAT